MEKMGRDFSSGSRPKKYEWVSTRDRLHPDLNAAARTDLVALMLIGEEYTEDDSVGSVPSSV